MQIDRPFPANYDLEKEYLGNLIFEPELEECRDMVRLVKPEYFHNDDHAVIFREIRKIVDEENILPDLLVIESRVKDKIKITLSEIGHLGGLLFKMPAIAKELKAFHIRRLSLTQAHMIIKKAYTPDTDGSEMIQAFSVAGEKVDSAFGSRSKRTTVDKIKTSCEEVKEATHGNPNNIKFHVDWFDSAVSHYRQQIHSIGGYPGTGKTIVGLMLFMFQLLAGMKVIYFCTESRAEELLKRMTAMLMDIQVSVLLNGIRDNQEQIKFAAATERLVKMSSNFWIFGLGDWDKTISGAEMEVRKIKRVNGDIDAIYLDYLQDVDVPSHEKIELTHEQVAFNAKGFNRIIINANAAGVMFCQFNRESKQHGKPTKQSFKGSGKIEEVSHLMSVLYRDYEDSERVKERYLETAFYSVKTRLVEQWFRKIYMDKQTLKYVRHTNEHRYGQEDLPPTYNAPYKED